MTVRSHNRILFTDAAGGLGQAMRPRLKANCTVLSCAAQTVLLLIRLASRKNLF